MGCGPMPALRSLLFGAFVACHVTTLDAQDPVAGKAVYDWICAACHGPEAEGRRELQAPSLRMQEDWYLQAQLDKFRGGLRGAHPRDVTGAPMQFTATGLDDRKVADVVAYVASLGVKGLPESQHAMAGDRARGEALYATCAGCHGPDARGNPALRAPGLAGQWDWYLVRQLEKFRAGIRGGDAKDAYGAQMAPFAAMLPDEAAILDVVSHIRSLPAPQSAGPPAQPDLVLGERAFAPCATCHGSQGEGNPLFHAPYLAGQGTWYVVRQLQNFRRGVRGSELQDAFGTQMRAIVAGLDDATLLDLAGHVASLAPPPRREPTPDFGGDLGTGERIYKKTCSPCHGTAAQGNRVLSAPSLAGQEDRYLARQLLDFRAGIRGTDRRDPPGRIMRAWAASLADDHEIRCVAAYIASLEPRRAHDVASIVAGGAPRVAVRARVEPESGPASGAGAAPVDPGTSRTWPRGLLSPGAAGEAQAAASRTTAAAAKPDATGVSSDQAPLATGSEAAIEAEARAGAAIFATCAGCHGIRGEGNRVLQAPTLAGLGDWYLAEQLRKFRSGVRGAHPSDIVGAGMRSMAATLADEPAIGVVARFIAKLPADAVPPTTRDGDLARGASLYAVCTACHGADARGNEALRAPALVGQADWYLATQLANFRSGVRGAHPDDVGGRLMRPMVASLVDDDAVRDVVAYVVSLAVPAAVPPTAEEVLPPVATESPKPDPPPAVVTPASLVGDTERGRALFATCGACHGVGGEGNVALKAPSLAGQEDWYLATQLRNFKAGVRGTHKDDAAGAMMRPMAMGLTDEQAILDVAAHAAGLKAPANPVVTLGGDGTRGGTLYAACIACHGQDAHGNAALKAPALAGQADWYVAAQLRNFKAGVRGAHENDVAGALMRPMAATLADDQAICDVAAFLSGLPPKGVPR